MQPFSVWEVDTLFDNFDDAILLLSEYCISRLLEPRGSGGVHRSRNSVESGAGPKRDNFKLFNIHPSGLLVTFQEYQIGGYAAGETELVIPYPLISRFLKPQVAKYLDSIKS